MNLGVFRGKQSPRPEYATDCQASASTFGTDFDRFSGTNDGYMNEIHSKRDQYGADIGVLITNLSDYCGMACINASSENVSGVVYHDCATG